MSYKERRKTIITMENIIITEDSYGTARYGCGVMDSESFNISSTIIELINCKEKVEYVEDEHESFDYSSPSHGKSQGMQYNWSKQSSIQIIDKCKPAFLKIKFDDKEKIDFFMYKKKSWLNSSKEKCWINVTEDYYELFKNLMGKFNMRLN